MPYNINNKIAQQQKQNFLSEEEITTNIIQVVAESLKEGIKVSDHKGRITNVNVFLKAEYIGTDVDAEKNIYKIKFNLKLIVNKDDVIKFYNEKIGQEGIKEVLQKYPPKLVEKIREKIKPKWLAVVEKVKNSDPESVNILFTVFFSNKTGRIGVSVSLTDDAVETDGRTNPLFKKLNDIYPPVIIDEISFKKAGFGFFLFSAILNYLNITLAGNIRQAFKK